jgi:hypothetical protein
MSARSYGHRGALRSHKAIAVIGASTADVVSGNWVGLDAGGTHAIPSTGIGITVQGSVEGSPSNTVIGGTGAGEGNVVSGNTQVGVHVLDGSFGTLIEGNRIGTDQTGTADLGNTLDGVAVEGVSGTVIGGTVAGARNLISGNDRFGVQVFSAGATGTRVQGNYIGTAADGAADLGNGSDGVAILGGAANTVVGFGAADHPVPGDALCDTGPCNVIARNGGAGVSIIGTGTGNTVRADVMFRNAGLGIDRGAAGVTPNDTGDADGTLNFPSAWSPIATRRTRRGTRTRAQPSSRAGSPRRTRPHSRSTSTGWPPPTSRATRRGRAARRCTACRAATSAPPL